MNKEIFNSMFVVNEKTWERLVAAIDIDDDIGVVLRAHLITENMLEAWCCAATNTSTLFDGFGESLTMSYMAKLKLASNLGLNQHSYNELKLLNKIRNIRSHRVDDSEVTNKEIDNLVRLIKTGDSAHLLSAENVGIKINDRGFSLNDTSLPNRQKLIAALGIIIYGVISQIM